MPEAAEPTMFTSNTHSEKNIKLKDTLCPAFMVWNNETDVR